MDEFAVDNPDNEVIGNDLETEANDEEIEFLPFQIPQLENFRQSITASSAPVGAPLDYGHSPQ